MLPNIVVGRYRKDSELVDRASTRAIEQRYSSVGHRQSSNAQKKYKKYEQEPTHIGRLKKLKEFLCNDNEYSHNITHQKKSKQPEKQNQCHTARHTSHKQNQIKPTAQISLREHVVNSMSKQRMRLKDLMEVNNRLEQLQPPQCDYTAKLSDRIKFFKLL